MAQLLLLKSLTIQTSSTVGSRGLIVETISNNKTTNYEKGDQK